MKLLLLVALVAFAADAPKPIPNYDFQGDTVREHRGQPDFCIAHNTAQWLKNCQCKDMVAQDACGRNARPMVKIKCKVECRNRCYCTPPQPAKPETTPTA